MWDLQVQIVRVQIREDILGGSPLVSLEFCSEHAHSIERQMGKLVHLDLE